MPFKSQAQRRKFAELLVNGKISPQTFEEWNRETGLGGFQNASSGRLARRVRRRSEADPKCPPRRRADQLAATPARTDLAVGHRGRWTIILGNLCGTLSFGGTDRC